MSEASIIRYMGSKVHLRPTVSAAIAAAGRPEARVVDLFGGAGNVCSWMFPKRPVTLVDHLHFPLCIARARFLRSEPVDVRAICELAGKTAATHQAESRFELEAEREALSGGWESLHRRINDFVPDVTTGVGVRTPMQHNLISRYFSSGYFSLQQSIELDALREAIDLMYLSNEGAARWTRSSAHDVALAGLLVTASRVANSPGHLGQFLRGGSDASFHRVRRAWSMSVVDTFRRAVSALVAFGDDTWRGSNSVISGDAIQVAEEPWEMDRVLFYADPPYTKDHYSRMYHVLETIYNYDFPDAVGAGRYPSDRLVSQFSTRSQAREALSRLVSATVGGGGTLILSYPTSGLVAQSEVVEILRSIGSVATVEVPVKHSTLGSSHGTSSVSAVEIVYSVTASRGA